MASAHACHPTDHWRMIERRIRVAGGPWPERIGRLGLEVVDRLDPKIYPRSGLGKNETIILLDDDPLSRLRAEDLVWSCVIGKGDIEAAA